MESFLLGAAVFLSHLYAARSSKTRHGNRTCCRFKMTWQALRGRLVNKRSPKSWKWKLASLLYDELKISASGQCIYTPSKHGDHIVLCKCYYFYISQSITFVLSLSTLDRRHLPRPSLCALCPDIQRLPLPGEFLALTTCWNFVDPEHWIIRKCFVPFRYVS